MRISSVFSGRAALVSAFALLVGCTSVIMLNPNEDGSGSGGGPIDAGMDVAPPDADTCSATNLSSGIVAHYPFDGDANDATGHGLNGIPEGTYSFAEGRIGKAIVFEDWETRVTVPDAPLLDTYYQFSLTAWVNPSSYPTAVGENPVIMAKLFSSDVVGSYVLNLQMQNTGVVDSFSVGYVDKPDGADAGKYTADGISVSDDLAAPKRIPIGVWTQVTATFDNGVLQLFLNGKLVAQKDSNIPHTELSDYQHDDLIIGNVWTDWAHSYTWHGALDDVRIYNRALSADEVACLAAM